MASAVPEKEGETYEYIEGKKLACLVCGHDRFQTRSTLMNTPGLTFFDMDWANKSAANYICLNCGFVHWFL